jgi:nitrogen fixation protein NifU and related proteins
VYSAELLDHFQNPRNTGTVESADRTTQLENPACGDVLELSLKIDGEMISEICFRARGCVAAMACGSALTELVKGRTVEEVKQLKREDLVRAIGFLPPASTHASHLAMETLRKLLQGL